MIDIFSHKKIASHLEKYNSLFRTFWDMGEIHFLEDQESKQKIPTAAIVFDKKSGDPIQFVFNKDFWDSIDDYTRTFVICHEMLHILLRHGKRMVDLKDNVIANVAMDISVNHLLTTRFGINQKKIQNGDKYIWIDNVFKPEDNVEPGRNFEYYFNKLSEKYPAQSMGLQEILDKLKSGELQFVDSHNPGSGDGISMDLPDANDLSEQEQDILDEIKKFIDENAIDDNLKEINRMGNENNDKPNPKNSQAGIGSGGWIPVKKETVKPKIKWITAARKWRSKITSYDFVERDNWVFHNRKYEDFFSNHENYFFQTDGRIWGTELSKKKINICLFLDISGSCVRYADRFWKAYNSIPKAFFKIDLFTFDTMVKKIDPEKDKIYGGGGTCFNIIEKEVSSHVRYPDHVWVITDGDGTRVVPKHPKRWSWFLTESGSTNLINNNSKIYRLNEFE